MFKGLSKSDPLHVYEGVNSFMMLLVVCITSQQKDRPYIASCTRYMTEVIPELLKCNEIQMHNKKEVAASDVSATGMSYFFHYVLTKYSEQICT